MSAQFPAKKLIVILGPTATGKSELAVRVAKKFGGEIISADSRAVYRGLDIGTAKVAGQWITKAGRKVFVYRGVPHYLLDFLDPAKTFSAADFAKQAGKLIPMLPLPIIVGGTGFWIDALLQPTLLSAAPPNLDLRKKLEKKSPAELFAKLVKLDPLRAQSIDPHNKRRLIRAIEIATSPPPSPHKGRLSRALAEGRESFKFDVLYLGLTLPNPKLKTRIKKRFLQQLRQGLLKETKKLTTMVSKKCLKEIGLQYPIIADYLARKISKEEMVKRSVNSIYHYAKRQKTWFKKNPTIHWITSYGQAARVIEKFLKKI